MAEQKFLGEAGLDVLVDSMKTSQTDIDTVQSQVSSLRTMVVRNLAANDMRDPLYMDGMCYVLGNGFLSPDSGTKPPDVNVTVLPQPGTPVVLTPKSTGAEKILYDRLSKSLPSALMVPVTSPQIYKLGTYGNWPFLPDPELVQTIAQTPTATETSSATTTIVYRCAFNRFSGSMGVMHDLKVVITRPRSNPTQPTEIQIWAPRANYIADNTPLLPFKTSMWSVSIDGTISPAGVRKISSTSTGSELDFYNRVHKGYPPAIGVDIYMNNTGSPKRTVWLYLDTVGSTGTAIYKSGTVSNGTYSNQVFQINVNIDSAGGVQTLLKMVSV